MSALFILLFSGVTHVAIDKKVPITKNEILRVDGFIVDLEYFMDTTIDRVSFDTLQFTVDYLNTTEYYSNYTAVFLSCFNKSYFDDGGLPVNCSWTGENISFMERIQPVLSNASFIYNISIANSWPEVTFRQYDSYAIEVNATMVFTIERPDMRWDVPLQRSRIVNFKGVTDPATVGTSFERRIQYAPRGGDLLRVGDMGGNVTRIQDFVDNGYYYRDLKGLSFLDSLEGVNLTSTNETHTYGINAFVPAVNATGDSLYKGFETSYILYHYTSNLTFTNPSNLVRFNETTGINSSLIFNKLYALNDLQVNDTSLLLSVNGCCDAVNCDPNCG